MGVTLKFRDMFDSGHIEINAINETQVSQIVFDIVDKVEGNQFCIAFDKATSIKLSKELRKQISLLED